MEKEKIHIFITDEDHDMQIVKDIKHKLFVEEKGIDENVVFSGDKSGCTFVVAKKNDKIIGCMQIRYYANFVKFERMAVLPEARGDNLSHKLIDYASKFCSKKGYEKVKSMCAKEYLSHWQKIGFAIPENQKIITLGNSSFYPLEKDISNLAHYPITENTPIKALCVPDTQLLERDEANSKLPPIISSLLFHKSKQNS